MMGVRFSALLLVIPALLLNTVASRGEEVVRSRNLAQLGEEVPGAGRTVAWSKDGATVDLPELADGEAAPVALPRDCVAFGVAWTVRHVANRVVVRFHERTPSPDSLELQVFDGEAWVPVRDGLKVKTQPGTNAIEYRFEPVASRLLRLRIRRGKPKVSEFEVYAYVPASGKTWPRRLVKDNLLEKDLLARDEEPSFESLSLHGLSMPTWAMMGLKDVSPEQAVGWDGEIVAQGCRIKLSLGDPARGLADVRDTVRRRLIDGWLPGVIVDGQLGAVKVRQTSFVAFSNGADEKNPGIFVRIQLTNTDRRAYKDVLRVQVSFPRRKQELAFQDGALVGRGGVYLAGKGRCRPDKQKNTIAWALDIAPGKTRTVEFVSPLGRWRPSKHLGEHHGWKYAPALAGFRRYWTGLLKPTMKLDLPEERLNHMYRSILTQLFINGHGDVMPYAATPSCYDGKLYGVEEGYAMLGLSMSGLYSDAQRYMDGTYLTKRFLRKADKYGGYGDRHQQYRNGLQPMYAVAAYRLSRDREWIGKHVPLLKKCAEWTIANRRKTMQEEDGKKPLHWGLLPKWSFGGDVASLQCYALKGNLCCWKGLVETAWLMRELGDEKTADRYDREAREYRAVIENVIDTIYRRDDKPPWLPLRVYGTKPTAGDYYQLFAGMLLDILPFDYGKERVNYITGYLERDNRLFCLLPRFRRDAGQGGLDALYGQGYILTKLFQGKTREFLLGFYAYQVFNLEHACFSSRETNLIYASDLHLRTAYKIPDMSDPLPCSSVVPLHFLRHMLMTEEFEGAGEYSGSLLLLSAAPRKWFRAGKTIAVKDAPTHFGKLSFRVISKADRGLIEVEISPPKRNPCKSIKLRVRHPEGRKIRKVTLNGREHKNVHPDREIVEIDRPTRKCRLRVHF